MILGIIATGTGYLLLRSYLHSDAFRNFLSAEASDMAGVTGRFDRFRWEGLAVDTDSFVASSDGPVTALRADGLHTEIGLGGVRRGVWEVRGSQVRRLELSLDARKPSLEAPTPPKAKPVAAEKSKPQPSWYPSKAELQGIDVRDLMVNLTLDQGLLVASGMSIHAEQADAKDAYRATVEGGLLRLPFKFIKELRLDRARLRYQDGQVFLTDSTVEAFENGRIQASGEYQMNSRRFSIEGDATGLKCQDILTEDWSKRLTGDVTSTFKFHNHAGFPEASGELSLQNGVITAMPMLDALAAYADTRRFRVLSLSEAHTGWHWKKGEFTLKNLVLSSEGLVRLEGDITIRGQELNGSFRLGLAPGTLSRIPGAETDVFIAGERGLLWTSLQITGTLDHPKEDLTDRLIDAAGMRMLDQLPNSGEKVLKYTQAALGEVSPKTVEKGLKIIEKNSDTIREVSDILGGLLNGKSKKKQKPKNEAQ